MGNQGTATDAFREQVELLQTGSLGEVRDVYVWCRLSNVGIRPLPTDSETPPPTLAWDCWLGPRAARPYNRRWVSSATWRSFGTGQLGRPSTAGLAKRIGPYYSGIATYLIVAAAMIVGSLLKPHSKVPGLEGGSHA